MDKGLFEILTQDYETEDCRWKGEKYISDPWNPINEYKPKVEETEKEG